MTGITLSTLDLSALNAHLVFFPVDHILALTELLILSQGWPIPSHQPLCLHLQEDFNGQTWDITLDLEEDI